MFGLFLFKFLCKNNKNFLIIQKKYKTLIFNDIRKKKFFQSVS